MPDSKTIHQAFENGEGAVIVLFVTQAKMFSDNFYGFKNTLKELEEEAALIKGSNDVIGKVNSSVD